MEEIGLPELTSEQIEELSLAVEKFAREYVLSKVPSKKIETLNISVEIQGIKPFTLTVEVDISLLPLMKDFDAQKLVDETVKASFASAEKYLKELKCHSQK